jgi:hypothetical protein
MLFGPMLVGKQKNSANYKVGDSWTTSIVVDSYSTKTVTTTISQSGTDIIYKGVFDDKISSYTLTVHSDNTFDYEQEFEMQVYLSEGNTNNKHIASKTGISGGTLTNDGFTASGVSQGITSWDDQATQWTTFYYGYDIKCSASAYALRMTSYGNSTVDGTGKGSVEFSNSQLVSALNAITMDTSTSTWSLSAGNLYGLYYFYRGSWGIIAANTGSDTVSFPGTDGSTKSDTAANAIASGWANYK